MTPANQQRFIDRLNRHPKLLERVEGLLNVIENVGGDCTLADAAEQQVIDELRKMGNDALHCWAATAVDKATEEARERQPELHGNGKKKSAGTRPSGSSRS